MVGLLNLDCPDINVSTSIEVSLAEFVRVMVVGPEVSLEGVDDLGTLGGDGAIGRAGLVMDEEAPAVAVAKLFVEEDLGSVAKLFVEEDLGSDKVERLRFVIAVFSRLSPERSGRELLRNVDILTAEFGRLNLPPKNVAGLKIGLDKIGLKKPMRMGSGDRF